MGGKPARSRSILGWHARQPPRPLVIYGAEDGALVAADATTGKTLWSFQTNHTWKASPMTYSFDGKQFVGVAAGSNIFAFGVQ